MVKMELESDQVVELINNYLDALQVQTLGYEILHSESVPSDKSQPDCLEFIENIKAKKTSILSKRKDYDSVLHVYSDLKLAVTTRLVQETIGNEAYLKISSFFKFAVDLLHREAQRLNVELQKLQRDDEDEENQERVNSADPNFETELSEDLYKVCDDYNQWTGEAYFIIGQHGPLFSSVNSKVSFDPRPTEVHGAFSTTQLVQLGEKSHTYSLGVPSSRLNLDIPHPALPPTEMMKGFVHPIDNSLPTSKWLKFDGYSSYAPAKDNSGVIIDDAEASAVWFEHFGNKQLSTEDEVKQAALDRIKELEGQLEDVEDDGEEEEMDVDKPDTNNEESTDTKDTTTTTTQVAQEQESAVALSGTTDNDNDGDSEGDEVNIAHLFSWRPGNFIDDDEIQAAKSGSEQQLVNKLILQLQQMQRVRLAHNDKSEYEITVPERRLAFKIQRILERLVGDTNPGELGLKLSSTVPVLQSVYNGSLPAPEVKHQPAFARLTNTNRNTTPTKYSKRR